MSSRSCAGSGTPADPQAEASRARAAVLLAPFLFRPADGAGSGSSRTAGFLLQVAVGALSRTGYVLTVYWAIGLGVSTGTTALVDGIQPLVVAALAGPLLGAAVTGRQWLGLGLGLAGVAVVTLADVFAPGSGAPGWAYLLPFAGMLCLGTASTGCCCGAWVSRP